MRKVLAFFWLTPQDLKYGVRNFVFVTLGLFIPGALGWLNEWTQWAPGSPYPNFAPLAAAAVAAVAGATVSVLTLVVRGIEGRTGKAFLRPNPPKVKP